MQHRLPVVVLGDGPEVRATAQGDVVTVDNGRMNFKVAPGFYGGVVSLEFDGVRCRRMQHRLPVVVVGYATSFFLLAKALRAATDPGPD